MKTYVIDRFEGTFAVLEDETGSTAPVPRDTLPPEAKEGDVLRLRNGAYTLDAAETARRRENARRLLQRLRERR